jgi:hypothetical protein
MSSDASFVLLAASVAGLGGGLLLLVRGFGGHRAAERIEDVATSRISSLAIGEVRVSGVVEPAEMTLVSPLQSRTCVYYRARVRETGGRERRMVLEEERAVGFRVRDATGDVRVFPRGASWDVPDRFGGSDDQFGGPPAGLAVRSGPAIQPGTPDRDELVARLLTVHPELDVPSLLDGSDTLGLIAGGSGHDYEEAWIEPGETVTIVGTVLPFDQLPDPGTSDLADAALAIGGPLGATSDPEIAADLAEARAAGTLETDSSKAWGNAAIPGFGIGRPTRQPELDPGARQPALADGATADRIERTFEIAPDALVLATTADHPLIVSMGVPGVAVARQEDRFLLGLAGAVVAIASAIVLALLLGGTSS